jgi:hypothetical protein
MDWFEISTWDSGDLEVCVCADFRARAWIVGGNAGCYGAYTMATGAGPADREFCVLRRNVLRGTYYVIVSTDGWIDVPCGSRYWAFIHEPGWCTAQEATWGTVKARYR